MAALSEMYPTPDLDLNTVLHELVTGIQAILGDNFIGAYLQGSLAVGGWDAHSDVDFLVVIEREVTEEELTALQRMHARIYELESTWAKHLDGSYIALDALEHYDPGRKLLYLDNGSKELIRSSHDNTLVMHWMVRECGVRLAGPEPQGLIDPVPAEALRQEVLATMRAWAQELFDKPDKMDNRWYQSFVVLSYCRMLHTLQTGRIESKPAGIRWAIETLDGRWTDLIQRAWAERPDPSLKVKQKADPVDFQRTQEFMRYAIELSRQYEVNES